MLIWRPTLTRIEISKTYHSRVFPNGDNCKIKQFEPSLAFLAGWGFYCPYSMLRKRCGLPAKIWEFWPNTRLSVLKLLKNLQKDSFGWDFKYYPFVIFSNDNAWPQKRNYFLQTCRPWRWYRYFDIWYATVFLTLPSNYQGACQINVPLATIVRSNCLNFH